LYLDWLADKAGWPVLVLVLVLVTKLLGTKYRGNPRERESARVLHCCCKSLKLKTGWWSELRAKVQPSKDSAAGCTDWQSVYNHESERSVTGGKQDQFEVCALLLFSAGARYWTGSRINQHGKGIRDKDKGQGTRGERWIWTIGYGNTDCGHGLGYG
jgi:hypothetical protein